MIKNGVLRRTGLGLAGLALLADLAACTRPATETNANTNANYFPGTINGRSPPATKRMANLSELTEGDIGSYVIAQYKSGDLNNGKIYLGNDGKTIIYSSRMDAMQDASRLREESPESFFEPVPIMAGGSIMKYGKLGSDIH